MRAPPAAPRADWAHTPERSSMFMLRFMTWFSLHLGRTAARGVLLGIAAYFLLFAPASRRASSEYLQRVFGRPAHWRELYRHIFTFAATIHDRIFLLNRRFDLFVFEVHGEETLRNLVAGGNGLILMGAHLGSFEVIRALGMKNSNLRIAMVMHEENARKINAMLAAVNPEPAQHNIGLGHVDSMLQVRERLDEGWVVGMLADRTPGNDTSGKDNLHPVQLLGANANLPIGPFRMAAFLRRPVVFMTGLYLGGNRYAIHFDPLADFSATASDQRASAVTEAITRYAALLDHYCREAPYNWFNFFDFWEAAPRPVTAKSQ
jgi:predicted LPLAT superfamily acyltransferase